jgi:hypothetical protein
MVVCFVSYFIYFWLCVSGRKGYISAMFRNKQAILFLCVCVCVCDCSCTDERSVLESKV